MKIEEKIFTEEELLKVAKLGETLTSEMVARHFLITPQRFSELKKSQPELGIAYREGAAIRTIRVAQERREKLRKPVTKLIRITESAINNSADLNQYTNHLDDFRKQFKENKERQLRRDLADLNFV